MSTPDFRLEVRGDLAALPDHAFGSTSLGWWGVIGFMLIEGMGFVLAIGAYYYLMHNEQHWPPVGTSPPLLWSSLLLGMGFASEIPNQWLKKRAQHYDLAAVRFGLVLMTLIGIAMIAMRVCEFAILNVHWYDNAYGSIVWAILALHTLHLVTDVFDSGVLAVLVFVKKVDGRKFSDVADNALYWHFIVWSWAVLYLVVYWTPRWL